MVYLGIINTVTGLSIVLVASVRARSYFRPCILGVDACTAFNLHILFSQTTNLWSSHAAPVFTTPTASSVTTVSSVTTSSYSQVVPPPQPPPLVPGGFASSMSPAFLETRFPLLDPSRTFQVHLHFYDLTGLLLALLEDREIYVYDFN